MSRYRYDVYRREAGFRRYMVQSQDGYVVVRLGKFWTLRAALRAIKRDRYVRMD